MRCRMKFWNEGLGLALPFLIVYSVSSSKKVSPIAWK